MGTLAQSPGSQSWGAKQQQKRTGSKEQPSPAGRAQHYCPVPRILFALLSQPWHWVPWASRLLPHCLSFPSWQGGGAWAGGGLPWRDPSPRVVAPCDIQRELAVTQSSGDLHGKGPPVWGQDFVWGQARPDSSTDHLAWWHDPPQLPTPGGQKTTPKRTSPVTLMAHGAAWGQPAPHARMRSAGVSTLFPLCCQDR